jgi:hypothetical protein
MEYKSRPARVHRLNASSRMLHQDQCCAARQAYTDDCPGPLVRAHYFDVLDSEHRIVSPCITVFVIVMRGQAVNLWGSNVGSSGWLGSLPQHTNGHLHSQMPARFEVACIMCHITSCRRGVSRRLFREACDCCLVDTRTLCRLKHLPSRAWFSRNAHIVAPDLPVP